VADAPERKAGRYVTAQQVAEKGVSVVAESMAEKLSARADLVAPIKTLIKAQHPAGIIGALKAMAERDDSSPYLSRFKFPVALVHGNADVLIPIDRSREVKAAILQARLFELSGVGHSPMLEDPRATADALRTLKV
jgi:pimeloyl-ACP methyl ester carboxylesterase